MHTITGVSENDKSTVNHLLTPAPLSDTPSRFLRKKVIAPFPTPLATRRSGVQYLNLFALQQLVRFVAAKS